LAEEVETGIGYPEIVPLNYILGAPESFQLRIQVIDLLRQVAQVFNLLRHVAYSLAGLRVKAVVVSQANELPYRFAAVVDHGSNPPIRNGLPVLYQDWSRHASPV